MRAVRLIAEGGPERLVCERIAAPVPGAGEALIRVHAAAITRDELRWPVDRLPAIPSYELSGVVAALGPGASGVELDEAVYALTPFDRDGVAADYAVVPCELLAPKPRTLSHVEAAAVPLPALSAWQGLFDHGALARGERVLIHGAAGGVGQFATQLARRRGAHVIATTSSRDIERALALGADEVIDHVARRFEDAIAPVDLVFDTVGGERLDRSPAVLRPGGRLVSVAREHPHATFFVVEPNREQLVGLAQVAEGGDLRPTIDTVLGLEDARSAFERTLSGEARGKVVMQVVG
jgi:NADPH:quinone reductase-like Zn-dependent oxidoreductase